MERADQEGTERDQEVKPTDRRLLEARRRKLGEKLKSRGLIRDDEPAGEKADKAAEKGA